MSDAPTAKAGSPRAGVAAVLAAAAVLASCAPPPEPRPLAVPATSPATAPAHVATTAPEAAPAATAVVAPPPAPPPVAAQIVTLQISGAEPRLLVPGVRAVLPGLVACFEEARPGVAGWLRLGLTVDASGAGSGVSVKGNLAPALGPCAERALAAAKLEARPGAKPATIEADVRIGVLTDGRASRELRDDEKLRQEADGTCAGVETFDCPPHKVCAAPKVTPVVCPTERGLPPATPPSSALRRVDVRVSGGKPGQGSEALIFSTGTDGCSVLKIVAGMPDPPLPAPDHRELSDIQCADFERIWKLATARFAGKRPRGTQHPDAVARTVALWRKTRADSVPVVDEAAWSGQSALDGAFGELVALAGPISAARGKMRLNRLEP